MPGEIHSRLVLCVTVDVVPCPDLLVPASRSQASRHGRRRALERARADAPAAPSVLPAAPFRSFMALFCSPASAAPPPTPHCSASSRSWASSPFYNTRSADFYLSPRLRGTNPV